MVEPNPAGLVPLVYPIPAPSDDARFTFGLLVDVARVLEQHGYPPVIVGREIAYAHAHGKDIEWMFLDAIPVHPTDGRKTA